MTSEYGAASQLEKIDMLDFAELIVLNKYDKRGAEDALRDIRKQWKRNHHVQFETADAEIPVYPTIASQFNDPGISWMFSRVVSAGSSAKGSSSTQGKMDARYLTPQPSGNHVRWQSFRVARDSLPCRNKPNRGAR